MIPEPGSHLLCTEYSVLSCRSPGGKRKGSGGDKMNAGDEADGVASPACGMRCSKFDQQMEMVRRGLNLQGLGEAVRPEHHCLEGKGACDP